MAIPDGLLSEVKNRLDITWVDAAEDAKLTGIIGRGIAYIDRIAGAEQDYTVDGLAKSLLMQYAMYDRSNSLSDYQGNNLHDLLALQIDTAVPRGE
jgi:hypothetical protein